MLLMSSQRLGLAAALIVVVVLTVAVLFSAAAAVVVAVAAALTVTAAVVAAAVAADQGAVLPQLGLHPADSAQCSHFAADQLPADSGPAAPVGSSYIPDGCAKL